MIIVIALTLILILVMLLPHLPGRYDASAAALSFVIQVASLVSLLLAPVGLVWIANPQRARSWHRLAFVIAASIALLITVAAVSVNHPALGVLLGIVAGFGIQAAYRRTRAAFQRAGGLHSSFPLALVCVPAALVAFIVVALPRVASWSRDRAIQRSAALIAEIESFRQQRGHYPVSLQALHPDFPTGVVGIDRFLYEPSGQGYNLFFVRPHIELDAEEAVVFNPRDEHHFTSHAADILQYEGEQLNLRRGDRRRTQLAHPHWISILLD
jgi:hypothetical protein